MFYYEWCQVIGWRSINDDAVIFTHCLLVGETGEVVVTLPDLFKGFHGSFKSGVSRIEGC